MNILAIDPGDEKTAVCVIDTETLKPVHFTISDNWYYESYLLMEIVKMYKIDIVAIEMISSYGMSVGRHVFDTCVWIGRFIQMLKKHSCNYVYRYEEKKHILGQISGNDKMIRRALIDRFAVHDFKTGKGVRNNPDFFHGFKKDVWAAYAVGLTFIETKMEV